MRYVVFLIVLCLISCTTPTTNETPKVDATPDDIRETPQESQEPHPAQVCAKEYLDQIAGQEFYTDMTWIDITEYKSSDENPCEYYLAGATCKMENTEEGNDAAERIYRFRVSKEYKVEKCSYVGGTTIYLLNDIREVEAQSEVTQPEKTVENLERLLHTPMIDMINDI